MTPLRQRMITGMRMNGYSPRTHQRFSSHPAFHFKESESLGPQASMPIVAALLRRAGKALARGIPVYGPS